METIDSLMKLCTLLICSAIMACVIIRLRHTTCKRYRLKYTATMLTAVVAMFEPYMGLRFSGGIMLMLCLCVLWLLVDGACALWHGEEPGAEKSAQTNVQNNAQVNEPKKV